MCSIIEYAVENTTIKPTYMLTYESATELLYLNLEEEAELQILSDAASLRYKWRHNHVIFFVFCKQVTSNKNVLLLPISK